MKKSLLILLALSSLSFSQIGIVTDKDTGLPIEGAKVTYGEEVTYTDFEGGFYFDGIDIDIAEDTITSSVYNTNLNTSSISWDGAFFSSDEDFQVFDIRGNEVGKKVNPTGIYFTRVIGSSVSDKWVLTGSSSTKEVSRAQLAKTVAPDYTFLFEKNGYVPEYNSYDGKDRYEIHMQFDHTDKVFPEDKVTRYDFVISKEDSVYIYHNGDDEEYIPATLRVRRSGLDTSFTKVGFRHKGSWSVQYCWEGGVRKLVEKCNKVSFKVKFNKYEKDSRLYGLKKLNLHSLSSTNTKINEAMSYKLYRDMGVETARTSFAEVYVNGSFYGLMNAVENIDGRFTKYRWPLDGDNNLYKEVWPNTQDESEYLAKLKTNDNPEDSADVSEMVNLAKALDTVTSDNFEEVIGELVDLESLVKYLAVDRFINNLDGVVAWYEPHSPHNFYWYSVNGKLTLIPWDMDLTLFKHQWMSSNLSEDHLPFWNVNDTKCPETRISASDTYMTSFSCDKLINMVLTNLMSEIEEQVNNIMPNSQIKSKLGEYRDLIRSYVVRDPNIDVDAWDDNVSWLIDGDVDFLRDLVRKDVLKGFHYPEMRWSEDYTPTGGIVADQVNNFEYASLAGISSVSSDSVTATVTHNEVNTVSGSKDVKMSYVFDDIPDANEWLVLHFSTDQQDLIDISSKSELLISVRSSKEKSIRLGFQSGDDVDALKEVSLRKGTNNIRLSLPELIGDSAKLSSVLSSVKNLKIVIFPDYVDGERKQSRETGSIQIDNILIK
jgi:hypothetical protein